MADIEYTVGETAITVSFLGPQGPGVPTGGTAGQALVKSSSDDYDTEWSTSAAPVDSVNGEIGAVVLDAADVGAAAASHSHTLSDITDAGTAAAADTGDFATAAQGSTADTAVQPGDLAAVATSGDYDDLSNRPTFKTVRNATGSEIPADTLVELSGAFGVFSTARVADNSTADHVAGITVAAIANNDEGEIQVTGTVEGLDTSGLTAGEPLYLGASGAFTETIPTEPDHTIRVGVVGVVHPTAGSVVFTLPAFEILASNVDGLGDSATLDVGTTAGTVAAGDHGHTLSNISDAGTAAAADTGDFATAAQGGLADSATQPGDDADTLGSGDATDGHVLTADGAGGAAWEAVPAAPVTSVNGETGVVVLDNTDVGAAATSHTHSESDITDLGSYVAQGDVVAIDALTQAQYDALGTPTATTLYIITA